MSSIISSSESATKSDVPGTEEQTIEAQENLLCLPDCVLDTNPALLTVSCGLCSRKYHCRCLELPEESPETIRGTYLCQYCLVALREHLESGRIRQEREARLASLEAQVAALDAEQVRLRERLSRAEENAAPMRDKGNSKCRQLGTTESEVESSLKQLQQMNAKRHARFQTLPKVIGNLFCGFLSNHMKMQSLKKPDLPSKSASITEPHHSSLENKGFRVNPFKKRTFMAIRTTHRDHQADDNYLYCDECNTSYLDYCPRHGQMKRIFDSIVPADDPMRAENSLPPGLIITPSLLPGAGLGVRAEISIEKGTVFGPYEGRKLPFDSAEGRNSEYSWKISGQKSDPPALIDGSDQTISNWLRFVNCPIEYPLRNLSAFQYKGHIFYRCVRNIPAGSELLVWYGGVFQLEPFVPTAPPAIKPTLRTEKQQPGIPVAEHSRGVVENESSTIVILNAQSIAVNQTAAPNPMHLSLTPNRTNPNYDQCHLCPIRVARGMISRHVKTAHADGLSRQDLAYLECSSCPLRFTQSCRLLAHVTRMHPEEKLNRGPSASKRPRRWRSETDEDDNCESTSDAAEEDAPVRPRRARCTTCPAVFASDTLLQEHLPTCKPRPGTLVEDWDSAPVPSPDARARSRAPVAKIRTSTVTARTTDEDAATYFQCSRCPERFLLKGFLLEHIRKNHPDDVDEEVCPHVCSDCGSRFLQLNHKNYHMAQCPKRLKRLGQSNSQATGGDDRVDGGQDDVDDATPEDELNSNITTRQPTSAKDSIDVGPFAPSDGVDDKTKSDPEMIILD